MGTCSVENCKNECFEKEDKCILHCEKDDKNGWYLLDKNNKKEWNSDKVILFWKNIKIILSESQSGISKYSPISFDHIIFPRISANGLAYKGGYGDTFKINRENKFTQSVNFNDCTFLDYVDFANIQFEKDIVFSKCTLKDEIKFKRQQNIRISFLNCPEIKSLDFSKNIFEQKVEIKECDIESCNFKNTRFKALCDFYNTTFTTTNFEKATFEDISVFTEATFKEDVNFKYTTFNKLALFRKTVFEKMVNFEDSIFKEEANFLEITSKKDKIEDIDIANRETARIIKNSFEKQNNIIEANKFYALEMKKREDELKEDIKKGKNIFEWLIFKAHAISSNHSQDWVLALLWIFNIGLIFSMFTSTFYHNNMLAYISILIVAVALKFNNALFKILISVNFIIFYWLSYVHLDEITDKINPFSIMTSKDSITFGLLLFKVTIAYLIYQFIVSVRQNTRRK